MSGARVELDDVRVHRRGHLVLDGCTASFGPGVTVVVGGNGAGKSTLLAAIAGLVPVSSGSITVAGRPVEPCGLSRWQGRRFGYLPQEPRLPSAATVSEAIEYARWLRRPGRREDDPGTVPPPPADLLERLGLASVARRPLGELSGGMNRLALFAVAASSRPEVLVLDEATAGIDVEHQATLRRYLGAERDRCAVLMSSHVLADVDRLADRVVVIARRRIVFHDEVEALRAHAAPGTSGSDTVESAIRLLAADDAARDRSST